MMQQLIETIVKPLVDYPQHIRIEVDEDEYRIAYKLFVHQEDRGKIIGKQGRIAKAIRTIVYSAPSSHRQKKTYVDIMD